MKSAACIALLVPAAAIAQTQPQITTQPQVTAPPQIAAPPGARPVIAPIDLRPRLQLVTPPCLARAPQFDSGVIGEKVIGEKGSAGIIGEKSEAIIGEKGQDAIIGEKGQDGIIGEKSEAIVGEKSQDGIIGEKSEAVIGEKSTEPVTLKFGDRWSGSAPLTFRHVVAGAPGRIAIKLQACSSAARGQVVRVKAEGYPFQHSLIATTGGASTSQSLILPQAKAGQRLSRLPLVFTVENPGGAKADGYYFVTITR